MGMMVDGKWHAREPPSWHRADTDGNFIRRDSIFRHWITA
ncbi:MAG: glutathione S-transferase family protein, partial [Planctomycetes bacterium]|nr:glutathione S-transferase family protein [Planctomycetota bacterium]